MTKEAVARQFFMDFIENLGESYEDNYDQDHNEEEANLILTDLSFSGLLEVERDPKKRTLLLQILSKKPVTTNVPTQLSKEI